MMPMPERNFSTIPSALPRKNRIIGEGQLGKHARNSFERIVGQLSGERDERRSYLEHDIFTGDIMHNGRVLQYNVTEKGTKFPAVSVIVNEQDGKIKMRYSYDPFIDRVRALVMEAPYTEHRVPLVAEDITILNTIHDQIKLMKQRKEEERIQKEADSIGNTLIERIAQRNQYPSVPSSMYRKTTADQQTAVVPLANLLSVPYAGKTVEQQFKIIALQKQQNSHSDITDYIIFIVPAVHSYPATVYQFDTRQDTGSRSFVTKAFKWDVNANGLVFFENTNFKGIPSYQRREGKFSEQDISFLNKAVENFGKMSLDNGYGNTIEIDLVNNYVYIADSQTGSVYTGRADLANRSTSVQTGDVFVTGPEGKTLVTDLTQLQYIAAQLKEKVTVLTSQINPWNKKAEYMLRDLLTWTKRFGSMRSEYFKKYFEQL